MRKQHFGFTKLVTLYLSVSFIISCKREITARPETIAATAASTAAVINPNAIFSGANDRYTVQSEVTSLLAGQVFEGFKDGQGRDAQFNAPSDVATDTAGNVYVADAVNNRIRKVTPNGAVSTVAGNGSTTLLNRPTGLAFGPDGSLYIADMGNNRILKLSGATLTTIAGTGVAGFSDGPGATAKFNAPAGIAVDANGVIYVSDKGNNRIRRISATGIVTQWVGDGTPGFKDGSGALAELNQPWGIAVGRGGAVYVADLGNNRIRKIVSGVISTIAGGNNTIYIPTGVATDAAGNIFVADYGRIRKITPAGVMTNLVGYGYLSYYDSYDTLAAIQPWGLTVDRNGSIYVAERQSQVIRKITPSPATRTLAGNGTAGSTEGKGKTAQFKTPYGIVVDKLGNIFVSDYDDNKIRKITPDGTTSLLTAAIPHPKDLAIDTAGNIYLLDETYHLRKISPAGIVTTIQTQSPWQFLSPVGIGVDPLGNIYIGDSRSDIVQKITQTGQVSIAFRLFPGYINDGDAVAGHATFLVSNSRSVFVGDYSDNSIYRFDGTTGGGYINGSYSRDPILTTNGFAADDNSRPFIVSTYQDRIFTLIDNIAPANVAGTVNSVGFADGPNQSALFNQIAGIAAGPGDLLYVADRGNHCIRVLSK